MEQIALGELALNTYDGYLFTKRDTGGVGIGTTVILLTPWTENYGAGSIYYQNNVGIGTDNTYDVKLSVDGTVKVTGVATFTNNIDVSGDLDVDGHTELDNLNVSGVSTFSSSVDIDSDLDVDGITNLDITNISETLNVIGIATFASDVYFNGGLNLGDYIEINNINVSSALTATNLVVTGSTLLSHSDSLKFQTTGIGVSVSNGIGLTATIAGPSNLIIDPGVVGDDTGVVRIKGDLFVDGTTTQINSTTIELADFIVGIATTATSDLLTDGAGIQIGPDNTFLYEFNGGTNPSLKSSENLNVASGKGYQIDQTEVLNATTLGTGVTNSSLTNLGTLTALTVSGAIDANGDLDVDGRTELDITNISETLNVSGVSTFASNVDLNADLDVDGRTELDITNISETLNVSGVSTFGSNVDLNADLDVDGRTELDITNISETLNVSGVSTFGSNVDVDGNLDVDGRTELDITNISETLNVVGVSTFASDVDLNADLDVDGRTELDITNISETLNVSGISTFASDVDLNANLDVDGITELDVTNISETLNVVGIATFANNINVNGNLDVDGRTELDVTNISETLSVTGITTFNSDVNVGGALSVTGNSYFVGMVTFAGGTDGNISIGDSTGDNVIFNAQIDSDLIPDDDGVYDLGSSTKEWKDLFIDGTANIDTLSADTASIGDLTNNRVVIVGENGELEDDVNLTFDGNQLALGVGLTVTGIATFANDIDANGNLDVDGITELDITNISETLSVTGIATFSSNVDLNADLDVDGRTELDITNISETLNVVGIATFANNIDANGNLDVDGITELDVTNISETLNVVGVSTFASDIDANGNLDVDGITELDVTNISETLSVTGIATFANNIDASGNLDVDGRTELDVTNISETLNVSGVSTFGSNVDLNADLDVAGNLDVDGRTELDITNISETLNVVGVSTFASDVDLNADLDVAGNLDVDGRTELDVTNISETLNVSGVSTFASDVDLDANLDVDGRTELDVTNISETLNVVGVSTFGSNVDLNGNLNVSGDLDVNGSIEFNDINVSGVVTATAFHTGAEGSAIRVTSNTISGPSEIIIDPAAVGDNTGAIRIKGDLFVDGTQTQINSTTIELADFIVGVATTATTNLLTDGAGIGIGSDKFFTFDNSNTAFKSTENLNLETGHTYKIAGTDVLSATTLGSGVVNSSLTKIGILSELNVSGVSTFTGNIDANGNLDVDGRTELDIVNIGETLNVVGIATFANNIDASGNLDVDGITNLDVTNISETLNVDGIATFDNNIDANGNLDVDGRTELDITNISETLNVVGVSTFTSTVNITPSSDVEGLIIDSTSASTEDTPHITLKGNGPQVIDFRDTSDGNGIRISYRTNPNQWRLEKSEDDGYIYFLADRDDGRLELYHNDSKKFETTGAGVTITGIATAATFYAESGTFAAGTDTQTDAAIIIQEEGSIYTRDGVYLRNLIQKKSDVIIIGQQNTSLTDGIELKPGTTGGSVKLHAGGSSDNVKLETTGAGVTVFGTTQSQQLNVSGVSTFTNNVIVENGSLEIKSVSPTLIFNDTTGTPDYKIRKQSGHFIIMETTQTNDTEYRLSIRNGGLVDIPKNLNVDGHTELDNLRVSGVSTFAGNIDVNGDLDVDGHTELDDVNVSGAITATTFTGDLTGNAGTATALETARTFEITGDVVASVVSFDGTGNVSLAATIQPNSVELGTDTTGDYVESVSGTSNEIEVTSGSGEGSTPTIGFVANPTIGGNVTIGQDLTVTRDLQVTRNLNVDGTVTIGGTSATIFAETLKISDPDLILGFRTDANGTDISNDTTANHGGIAIASTEGSPLVTLVNPGAGETLPSTYKKIMWFKTSSFTGLSTDAWLSNYAFGVGTTSMSAGTKFAVGNIEADFDDITSVRHINSSGVITATTFSGSGASLTTLNASNLASGTIPDARFPATLPAISGANLTNLPVATNVPVADESSDTTCFPIFTTEATGTLALKSGSNLTFNSSNGTLTATAFSGDGSALTNLSNVIPDVVSDTTPQLGGTLDTNGNLIQFGDSSGATDDRLQFGAGNDLEIFHDSVNSHISNSTGTLFINQYLDDGDIVLRTDDGSGGFTNYVVLDGSEGSVNLYHYGNQKLQTTSTGIDVTGHTETDTLNVSGISTFAGNVIASGNIGIGTDNPSAKLDVRGTLGISNTDDTSVRTTITSSAAGLIVNHDDNSPTIFQNQGVEKVRITSDGSVGIGTDDPKEKLHIENASGFETRVIISQQKSYGIGRGTTERAGLDLAIREANHTADNRTFARIETGTESEVSSNGSFLSFSTRQAGNIGEKLRITSGGKVGIGTDNPNYLLDVYKSTGTNQDVFSVRGQTSAFLVQCSDLSAANPTWNLRSFASEDIAIKPGNSESVRFKADGNVGIGTDVPNGKLHLSGSGTQSIRVDTDGTALSIYNHSEFIGFIGNDAGKLFINAGGTEDTLSLRTNGTERLRITSDGKVGINSTAPGTGLDIRSDDGIFVRTVSNNPTNGARIQFSDQISATQRGHIKYKHADNSISPGSNDGFLIGGTENLTVVKVEGRAIIDEKVGIGTDSPGAKLEVRDDSATGIIVRSNSTQSTDTNKALRVQNNSDANTFHVSHKGQGYFASSVGIGTDNPQHKLNVYNATASGTGGILVQNITFASNEDRPYLTVGTKDWTGATTNWNTFGFQHRIKSNSGGTPRITVDSLNGELFTIEHGGNIGIGTDNPQADLHIESATPGIRLSDTGNSGAYAFIDANAANAIIHADKDNQVSNSRVAFSVDNDEKVRITSDGLMGIGTDNPLQKLHVLSDVSQVTLIERSSHLNSGIEYKNTIGSMFAGLTSNATSWAIDDDNNLGTGPMFCVLREDGNVGINKSDPGAKLDVYGDAIIGGTGSADRVANFDTDGRLSLSYGDNSNNSVLTLKNTNTSASTGHGVNILWQFGTNAFSTAISAGRINVIKEQQWTSTSSTQDSALSIDLTQNGAIAEKIRITSGGDVGIGLTNPAAKLHVGGDINYNNNAIIANNSGSSNIDHFWHSDSSTYGQGGVWNFVSDGTYKANGSSAIRAGAFANMNDTGTASQKLQITGGAYISGDVGIGVTNPAAKLDVRGTLGISNTDDTFVRTTITSSATGLIVNHSDNSPTIFQNQGTERVRITSDGNIGIGTDNPDAVLDANPGYGTTYIGIFTGTDAYTPTTGEIRIGSNQGANASAGDYVGLRFSVRGNGSGNANAGIFAVREQAEGNGKTSLAFATRNWGGNSNLTEKVRITSGGDVGIGVTNPTAKLDVNGDIYVGDKIATRQHPDNSFLDFDDDNIPGVLGQNSTNNVTLASISGLNLIFDTNDNDNNGFMIGSGDPNIANVTNHMVISGDGLVGIANTNPTAKLDVNGTVNVTGVSTFQNNVHLLDNDKLLIGGSVGTHDGLEIYHDSNHSYIDDSGTGNLYLRSGTLSIQNLAGSKTSAVFQSGSSQEFYFNNSKKFETTATGILVRSNVGLGTTEGDPDQDLAVFRSTNGNTSLLRIVEGRDVDGTSWTSAYTRIQKTIDVTDQAYIQFNGDGNTYGMEFGSAVDNELFAKFVRNGAVELYHNGDKKFETGQFGVTVTGSLAASNIDLVDNAKLLIGTGDDLQIYHNGSDSYIEDSGTGALIFKSNIYSFRNAADSEQLAKFTENGSVELWYDNSKKFETTGIGVSISNGIGLTATIAGPSNLIIDPGVVGDDTGVVRIKGDLFVDGTTTQINSTTIELADFIVGIATTATTDLLADGAGIKIGPDNTFLYEHNGGTNPSLKSSENLNVASGKGYQINQTEVLNATTLGSNVVNSSLTSVGTLGSLTVSGSANFISTATPITTNAIKFNNTENDGNYYTDAVGTLVFDENFYNDTEYGSNTYSPNNVFTGTNGGGILIKNEDGWGAVFTSQNTRFATAEWDGLTVGSNRVLTVADADELGRRVVTTATGTNNDANYWAKIATFSTGTTQYNDGTIILAVTNEESSNAQTAIISVFFRSNATNTNPTVGVEILSRSGLNYIKNDSLKVISDGWSTDMELWVKKGDNYGGFAFYEISKNISSDSNVSLTYHDGATWQQSTPSGSVNNVVPTSVPPKFSRYSAYDTVLEESGFISYYNIGVGATPNGSSSSTYWSGIQSVLFDDTKYGWQLVGNSQSGQDPELYVRKIDNNSYPNSGAWTKILSEADLGTTIIDDKYLRSDANDTFTGIITGATLHLGGSQITNSSAKLQVNGFMRTGSVYIHEGGTSPNTTSKELANVSGELYWENQEVWNAGNDGDGSGLDADLLDGQHGSFYLDTSSTSQTKTGQLIIDTDNQQNGALRIENHVTDTNNDFYFAQEISQTLSGIQTATSDREQGGIYMDINSTNTGGDTSNEHRAYGMYIDLDSTGDSDLVYGVYADATATPTTGTTTEIAGVYGRAEDNGGAGNVTTLYGVRGLAVSDNSNSDTNSMYGGYFKSQPISDTGNIGAAYGVYAEIEIPDGTGDHLGNSYVVRAVYDDNDGVAQSNTTYLFHGDYTGTNPTNAYGVYIAEPNADNYFAGNVGINETDPLAKLHITGAADAPCLVLPDATNPRYSVGFGNVHVSGVGQRLDFYAGDSGSNTANLTSAHRRMSLTAQGRLGIGTENPSSYNVEIWDDTIAALMIRKGSTSRIILSNDSITNTLYSQTAAGGDRDFAIKTGTNERLRIKSDGKVGIGTDNPGYKLEVNGSFAATTKSFVIDHPTKPNHKLRYGSLEGPENGVYARGRSKEFIIELPKYWTGLVDPDSITVNLTPIGKSQTLWVKDIEDNKVYVGSKCSEVNYFYTVFAERNDVEKLEVEFSID